MLVPPIAHLEAIDLDQANRMLELWQHKMGPCNRPFKSWAHGLHEHGQLVAVAVTATMIPEETGGFTRAEAVELARLCAARPGLCRVMLRLWREMVLPSICMQHGYRAAISYQDSRQHSGDTYRFDGWKVVGETRSGTDKRGDGRKGRNKRIWAWQLQA